MLDLQLHQPCPVSDGLRRTKHHQVQGSPWRCQQELLEEEEATGMVGREVRHCVLEPQRKVKVKCALTI